MRRTTAGLAAAAALATAVLGAPPAAAASIDNTDLVAEWYEDFLLRDPLEGFTPGRGYWVVRLGEGADRASILREITRSEEYARSFTNTAYSTYLDRVFLDEGAQYWIDGMRAGMAPEWVEQNILASPEYRARTASTSAWVGQLYAAILGREASAGERAYWAARTGDDHLGVVRDIWYSAESITDRLADEYTNLLGRAPDASAEYWRPRLVASRLETEIAIASTEEYAELAAVPETLGDDPEFVLG